MTIIEQIKNRIDIAEEIGAVVPLKKSGKAYKGACPFHSERTPSFYVFPQTGTWRCFGCNEGGDIFTFVEKQQGLDFKEVLALLAEKAGIALEARGEVLPGSEEGQEEEARRRLRQINEAAALWFHHLLLASPEATYARAYLDGRGVSHESLTLFRLGFAPAGGDLLCKYLLGQEYTAQEIIAAGLGREREPAKGGGLYDYFRSRVIFPIRDARGRAVGFGGRELGGGSPKYLNTPQTPLFDKSSILYGLDLAREAIKRRDQVVIVEGYMDALIAHQYGEKNVVACIGSAITEKHVRQLKKLTRRLALALDPDTAGETATLRGIEVAKQGFDRVVVPVPATVPDLTSHSGRVRGLVRTEEQVDAEITVLRLPPGEDPDEVIRRDVGLWRRAEAEALPLIDYLFEVYTADLQLDSPQGKADAAKRLIPALLEVRDSVKQDAYFRRLAGMLHVSEQALQWQVDRMRRERTQQSRGGQQTREPGLNSYTQERSEEQTESASGQQVHGEALPRLVPRAGDTEALMKAMEEYCLGLLLACPILTPEVCGIIEEADFTGTETRTLYHSLVTACQRATPPDIQHMLSTLPDLLQATAEHLRQEVEARERMEGISRTRRRRQQRMQPVLEAEPPLDSGRLRKVATKAAYRLKRARLKEALNELLYLRQEAERAEDHEGLHALDQRRREVLLQMETIDSAVPLHS